MSKKHYRFYMDETDLGGYSSQNLVLRQDGLACFCYAGVLIAEEDIETIRHNHANFCMEWRITYPLHYNSINSRTGNYDWLGPKSDNHNSNRGEAFIEAYHDFITNQPFLLIGSVIDKSFFDIDKDQKQKTIELAFSNTVYYLHEVISVDKSTVKLYCESVGRKEDVRIRNHLEELKKHYKYHNTIIGEMTDVKKSNPFTQLADYCAYALAKSSNNEKFRPFKLLQEKNRIQNPFVTDKHNHMTFYYSKRPQKE